jgi:hypothetical protein
MPRTGPRWIRFIKWVVKPDILFLRRFEGTSACPKQIRVKMEGNTGSTHNFIDNPLVGVEIESQTGVAGTKFGFGYDEKRVCMVITIFQ